MSVGRFLQQGAAGNAGEAVYVDDVFSTYLYDGTGSAQTITNGIDLDGEGGMVIIKGRDAATGEAWITTDTERGAGKYLQTFASDVEYSNANVAVQSFTSSGFGLTGSESSTNGTLKYASWAFRKQPGFFDVVTYTGNGTARTISHNLGSAPGMIIVKNLDTAYNWVVYHNGLGGNNYYMYFNTADGIFNNPTAFWTAEPTSSVFSIGTSAYLNNNGDRFVAYLFAHDAQDFGTDSDESIIKCGSYTGNASATGPVIDLGFEPQWLMIKKASIGGTNGNWLVYDSMRGLVSGGNDYHLLANSSTQESNDDRVDLTSNGFKITSTTWEVNSSGSDYIYVAIRRPHKPAEEFAATDLFTPQTTLSTTVIPLARYQPGHLVDMVIAKATGAGFYGETSSRLTQGKYLNPDQTFGETSDAWYAFGYEDGFGQNGAGSAYTSNSVHYMFRRAPGFFDVVAYTGTGSTRTVSHNLGVAPEMMIFKCRTNTNGWAVYHSSLGNTKAIILQSSGTPITTSAWFNDTTPTDSVFTLGSGSAVNQNTIPIISYHFASVPGISKVGSYTGTGADVDVNCGFTSGARFVLVKRTDSTGDWYVWDSVRGIVAGNDPYLLLNTTAAQVTSTDYIDPLSSGFTITSSAPAALNASGGSYLFLAIA